MFRLDTGQAGKIAPFDFGSFQKDHWEEGQLWSLRLEAELFFHLLLSFPIHAPAASPRVSANKLHLVTA